jgi:hypothetical protein
MEHSLTLDPHNLSAEMSETELTNCIKDLRSILQRGDLRLQALPPSPHAAARSERARREEEEELATACASNCWLSSLEPAERHELLLCSERVPFAAQDLILDAREHRRGALFLVLCGHVSLIAHDPAGAAGAAPRECFGAAAAGDAFSARDIGAHLPHCGAGGAATGMQFRLAVKAWGRRAGACRVFPRAQVPPPPPQPPPAHTAPPHCWIPPAPGSSCPPPSPGPPSSPSGFARG